MAIAQLDVWVRECSFPRIGSLSVKQLEGLRVLLKHREEMCQKTRSKKESEPHWKAFDMWMGEAKRRQAPEEPAPQCVKLDPDLDRQLMN